MMASRVRLVSTCKTPGIDVSAGALETFRAIKVSAYEMGRLPPSIREQLYEAARSMRPAPALKRVK